jgi:hypothetical protein
MNVIQRARESGRCPPSLLRDEPKEDGFEAAVAKVLDASGTSVARKTVLFVCFHYVLYLTMENYILLLSIKDLSLTSGPQFLEDFKFLLKVR